jgi:flagellar motor switch protein FliN/FliY
MSNEPRDSISRIASEYANSWGIALGGMTGEKPETKVETGVPAAGISWWEYKLNSTESIPVWVGAGEQVVHDVGKRILDSAGVHDTSADEIKNTFLEVAAQAVSSWAGSLNSITGRALSTDGTHEPGTPDETAARTAITAKFREEQVGPIFIAFPASMSVKPESGEQKQPSAPAAAEPGTDVAPLPDSVQQSRTLDLLLEVELPVSVSFGRARLPLKDVLKLTSGAIVELNRSISEPVEVIVNNCVIARGEVVVVDGYYGIRIQQIVSKQERLRSLN